MVITFQILPPVVKIMDTPRFMCIRDIILVRENWPSVIVGKTSSVEDAVFADLNDDGAVDEVTSSEGKNKKVYINWAPSKPNHYLDSSKWETKFFQPQMVLCNGYLHLLLKSSKSRV